MREAIPIAAAAAIVALIVGAAGMYLLMPVKAPDRSPVADAPKQDAPEPEFNREPPAGSNEPTRDPPHIELKLELAEARAALGDSEDDNSGLRAQIEALGKDKKALEAKVTELEARVTELGKVAAGPNRMLISFGKWAEVKEVRETDWNDLGDAYAKMTPLLKAYAAAAAAGKQPDVETSAGIKKQNDRLIAHYAKVLGKLPTHAGANGEFTHPINMANILAGQLAEAGLPLSDEQKQEISALGEEFDKRWAALAAGYTEATWALQKLMDEAELKQWFYDGMFAITTPEQRNAAVPPELQGLIGLDLYSPGLMLQGNMLPLREPDMLTMKASLKESVTTSTSIPRETLDGADYIFDDWLTALQLQPLTALQLDEWRTLPVLKAGQTQLVAMRALDESVVVDEEIRKKFRFVQRIVVPQLVKQE